MIMKKWYKPSMILHPFLNCFMKLPLTKQWWIPSSLLIWEKVVFGTKTNRKNTLENRCIWMCMLFALH